MAAAKPIVAGVQMSWQDVCQQALHTPVSSVKAARIGSLWGRYGSVVELQTQTEAETLKLIAKQVDPPAGGGGVSQERKLNSYEAEAAFYTHFASRVLELGACAISKPLLVDVAPPHFFFLLTDLRPAFPQELSCYNLQEAAAALTWLAGFHALWWEEVPGQDQAGAHGNGSSSSSTGPLSPAGLWAQGSYWHLDTRQEEFRSMSDGWKDLKAAAVQLDEVLKGICSNGAKTTKHRTLIHGDFKSENVLFDAAGKVCAAYDFQYCGEGLGVRDVAYLLVSSLDADVLEQHEQELLDHYWKMLLEQLCRFGKQAAADSYTFEALQAQFDVCVADYTRFMAGWGLWGNSSWARRRTKQVLQQLPAVIKAARANWAGATST